MAETVNQVITAFTKKHPEVSIHSSTMPSCCSGLMIGGFYRNLTEKSEVSAVELLEGIARAAKTSYAFLFATMLMPGNKGWENALKKAGWEMSEQVAKSNSYNGSVPMRVFIKSLRPITKKEAVKKTAAAKKEQTERQKRGYDW